MKTKIKIVTQLREGSLEFEKRLNSEIELIESLDGFYSLDISFTSSESGRQTANIVYKIG